MNVAEPGIMFYYRVNGHQSEVDDCLREISVDDPSQMPSNEKICA